MNGKEFKIKKMNLLKILTHNLITNKMKIKLHETIIYANEKFITAN